ncbi:MAG: amidohydrolase [Planctomycetota bacterium]
MAIDTLAAMRRIDDLLSHVWMVRTFIKHSEEIEEDDELAEVQRELYDFLLALGPTLNAGDSDGYLKQARKKWSRFEKAAEKFQEIQPEISLHTNFKMAARSLAVAITAIRPLLLGSAGTGSDAAAAGCAGDSAATIGSAESASAAESADAK